MDIEQITSQYIDHLDHAKRLGEIIDEYKQRLIETVESEGDYDENGHQWLPAGRFLLQRQRRESRPVLDHAKAVEWAKERGIWESVSRTVEVLDEDALVGYIYEHKDEEGLEETFQSLHTPPKVTYAFLKPKEVTTYEY